MRIFVRSLFIAAALAGTAYADQPAPPATKKPAPTEKKAPTTTQPSEVKKAELSPAEAEKFLVFFNKFVDTVVAAKEDCAKLTKDINVLIDANTALLKQIQDAKAANKDLPQATKDKMMSRVKEMMPAMQKCGQDPSFQAAMKRMEGKAKGETKAPPSKTDKTAPSKDAKAPTPTK